MNWKIFVKPALKILDTMLDGLIKLIREGRTEDAINTIEEVRNLIKEASKLL